VAMELGTVTVIVEVPEPGAGMGLGLKDAVTPVGWPEAASVIAASNPFEPLVVIVVVPLAPWATETEPGDEMVKVGPEVTVKLTVVL